MGMGSMTVLSPPSRMKVRTLERLEFVADGELEPRGERFRRYRPGLES